MPGLFRRVHADHTEAAVELEGQFAGPDFAACWLLGGGPSLGTMPMADIAASPIPKLAINLAGAGLIRPNFWTSYDPSARFHRSVYLDPGIMKFVHRRRAMDLVPETTYKVCECPNLYFFERDGDRGFADFVSLENKGIVDWADSMVQAIDILFRLGFRRIYLAGCEMRVTPTEQQIALAASKGVTHEPNGLMSDFLKACQRAGLSEAELDAEESVPLYHFDERKKIRAAANCDTHYFRIVQYLRLSRRAMSLAGLQLISVTPNSRLNDHFRYQEVAEVLDNIYQQVGNPRCEPTRGLYHAIGPRQPEGLGPMRDYRPHHWPANGQRPGALEAVGVPALPRPEPHKNLPQLLREAVEEPIDLHEEG